LLKDYTLIKIYKYCSNGEYYADSGEYEEELWDETSENIIAYIKDNHFAKSNINPLLVF
jgi:hypothetical protein